MSSYNLNITLRSDQMHIHIKFNCETLKIGVIYDKDTFYINIDQNMIEFIMRNVYRSKYKPLEYKLGAFYDESIPYLKFNELITENIGCEWVKGDKERVVNFVQIFSYENLFRMTLDFQMKRDMGKMLSDCEKFVPLCTDIIRGIEYIQDNHPDTDLSNITNSLNSALNEINLFLDNIKQAINKK